MRMGWPFCNLYRQFARFLVCLLKSWYSGGCMLTEHPLLNAVIFASLGIAVFTVAAAILLKATPLKLWRELVEERNVAGAIFVSLGIAVFTVAAAILLKATPLKLWRELVEERNVAVAIFASLGIAVFTVAA